MADVVRHFRVYGTAHSANTGVIKTDEYTADTADYGEKSYVVAIIGNIDASLLVIRMQIWINVLKKDCEPDGNKQWFLGNTKNVTERLIICSFFLRAVSNSEYLGLYPKKHACHSRAKPPKQTCLRQIE